MMATIRFAVLGVVLSLPLLGQATATGETPTLVDTVVLESSDLDSGGEPLDADGDTDVDADDHHILDGNGETQFHDVVWDDIRKVVRTAGGPIRLAEIVHAEVGTLHLPAEGAVVRVDIEGPHGCGYFTDPTGAEDFGGAITGLSDTSGRFVGPVAVSPNTYPTDLTLWPNGHAGSSPQQDYSIRDIWVDCFCEDEAIVTVRAGYRDSAGPLPVPPTESVPILWSDDFDRDGVRNVADNCPLVSNPEQEDADGDAAGDACDQDDDNDSLGGRDSSGRPYFRDEVEAFVGTDPLDACADGRSDAAWPPDFNNDRKVGLRDVVELCRHLGSREASPRYSARHDLNADGRIGWQDAQILKRYVGKTCS